MTLSRGEILVDPVIVAETAATGGSLSLRDGTGSRTFTWKASNSASSSYTVTLPGAPPAANGYYLSVNTDGSSTWSQVTAAAGGSPGDIQFNSAGIISGASLSYNSTTNVYTWNNVSTNVPELRLEDSDGSNYFALKPAGTLANNNTYTLPSSIGSAGQVLKLATGATSTAATLEWGDAVVGSQTAQGNDGDVQLSTGSNTFKSPGTGNFNYNTTTEVLTVKDTLNIVTGTAGERQIQFDGTNIIQNNGTRVLSTFGNITINSNINSPFSNVIATTNTNGNLVIDPNGSGIVEIVGSATTGGTIALLDAGATAGGDAVRISAPTVVSSPYTLVLPDGYDSTNSTLHFDVSKQASYVSNLRTLSFLIDGGGQPIQTGVKGYVLINGNFRVTQWTIVGDTNGTITINVEKASYANYPTFSAFSGGTAGTQSPAITVAGSKNQSTAALTSWAATTPGYAGAPSIPGYISNGDILRFTVSATSAFSIATIALTLQPERLI